MPLLNAALLALLMVAAGLPAHGRQSEADRIEKIKAGMILNFVRFTEWPADRFESADSPIVIAVLGPDALEPILEQTLSGQTANNRRMRVVRLAYPFPGPGESAVSEAHLEEFVQQLRDSHVLFIAHTESSRVRNILGHVRGADVLTVGDAPDFAERGGMLGLAVRGGRMAFDANVDEIQDTRIRVSSKVLRLARIVHTRES